LPDKDVFIVSVGDPCPVCSSCGNSRSHQQQLQQHTPDQQLFLLQHLQTDLNLELIQRKRH